MRAEVERIVRAAEVPVKEALSDPETGLRPLSEAVLELKQVLALTIPERARHLAWLTAGGNVMVFGPRGVGKTMLQLALTASLATGRPFWKWAVAAPVGVLYIDGEMPLDELRTRLAAFLPEHPQVSPRFLTSEFVYHHLHRDLVLTDEGVRDELTAFLDVCPEVRVVILDNISCLFAGLDENAKRDWEPINAWLIRLRHRGLATILVHHSGKGGQQRGTSGREDALDTIIRLEYPPDYDPQDGCHFELTFVKSRCLKGEPVAPLDLRLTEQNGQLIWTWKPLEKSKEDLIRELLAEGVTKASDLAEAAGISRAYAWKLKRRLGC